MVSTYLYLIRANENIYLMEYIMSNIKLQKTPETEIEVEIS